MRRSLFFVPLLATACAFPRFEATRTVDVDVAVEQAARLHCKTHNGSIRIRKGASEDTIRVHAELKVRGHTQQEADDNLTLMDVGSRVEGDALFVFGDYPEHDLRGMSPSFSFTMDVPERLALQLITHNGSIEASGTSGAIDVTTHNGSIDCSVANTSARAETHNGRIELRFDAPGAVDGDLITHNGSVTVHLHEQAHGWIEAETHNGDITPPADIHDAEIGRRSVRCRVGDDPATEGRLEIVTHNGSVTIR